MRSNGITVVIESDRQWFGQPWQRVSRICEPIRRFDRQAAAAIRGPGENHQYGHRPDYPPLRIVRLPHGRMVAENTKLRDIVESVPHCLSYVGINPSLTSNFEFPGSSITRSRPACGADPPYSGESGFRPGLRVWQAV